MKYFILLLTSIALLSGAVLAESSIPVISGGVGEESRQMIQSAMHSNNTKLLFTGEKGIYLSDVHVTIQDKHSNTLVDEISDGPIMLMNLPAGKYRVSAEASGFTKQATLTATQKLKTHQFTFPVRDAVSSNPEYQQEKLQGNLVQKAAPADYDERNVLQYQGQPATIKVQ